MAENSETIEARLCAYVEGALDDAERAEIEKHLEIHPQHRRLLAELGAQRDWLRRLPHEKAPGDLLETVDARLERSALLDTPAPQRDRTPGPRMWVAAAAVALAGGLGVLVYTMLPRKPAAYQKYAAVDRPAPAISQSADDTERQTAMRRRESTAPTSAPVEIAAVPLSEMSVSSPALDLTSRVDLAESAGSPVTDRVVLVVQADDPQAAHGRVREFFAHNHLSWSDASAGWGGYAAAPTVLAQPATNSPRTAGGFGGAVQGGAPYPGAPAAAPPAPGPATQPVVGQLGPMDVAADAGAPAGAQRGLAAGSPQFPEALAANLTAYQTVMTRGQAASLQEALAAPEVARLRDQVQAYGLRLESATTQPAAAGLGAAAGGAYALPPLAQATQKVAGERATTNAGSNVIADELTLRASPPAAKASGILATTGPSVGFSPATLPADAPIEVVVLIERPASTATRPAASRPSTQPARIGP